MPTLKEIKGRIASVRGTLKITSAMKLVSSAKLRKAQKATEAMRPYEAKLQEMLAAVGLTASDGRVAPSVANNKADAPSGATPSAAAFPPAAIIAIASNSSLCGGFNANAVAKVRSVRQSDDVVYSIGRKMADAMRRDGFPSPEDFSALSENPAYAPAAALVEKLQQDLAEGRISRVLLVYNHFVSTARQVPVVEELLARDPSSQAPQDDRSGDESPADAIFEPSRKDLLAVLEPKLLKLKLYAALLDSAAAEHAARTVAMQTATDNGEKLLQELTLQYNKGRQQKITSEILDLAGGQAAQ